MTTGRVSMMAMFTAIAKDSTPIAFWCSGGESPLLLVHGTTADHITTWCFVLPEFERRR